MTTSTKEITQPQIVTNHILYPHGKVGAISFAGPGSALLVPVSCDGEIAKDSMAGEVARNLPKWFERYTRTCKASLLFPGKILYNPNAWEDRNVIAFPTKVASNATSQLHVIEAGLQKLIETIGDKDRNITSLVVTKMGCSKTGLKWEDVGPLMLKYFAQLSIPVTICIGEKDKEYHLDSEGNLIAQDAPPIFGDDLV